MTAPVGSRGKAPGLISQRAVFLTIPVFATVAAASVLSIPGRAIDRDRARGPGGGEAKAEGERGPSGLATLLRCRPLVVFALCAMLFHFANAPRRCPTPPRARPEPASHQASGRHEAPTASYRPCWIADSSQLPPRGRTKVHSSTTICRSFGLPSTTRPVRSVVTSIVE